MVAAEGGTCSATSRDVRRSQQQSSDVIGVCKAAILPKNCMLGIVGSKSWCTTRWIGSQDNDLMMIN